MAAQNNKRLSASFTDRRRSIVVDVNVSPVVSPSSADTDEWIRKWSSVTAKDLMNNRIVEVDADTTVEDACDVLLSQDTPFLAIKSLDSDSSQSPYLGLFDFSDVNAFLTLAATRHTLSPDTLRDNLRLDQIVTAAKAGRVPVHLVSNLSEKNPLASLPNDASIINLLELFAAGVHRVLITSSTSSSNATETNTTFAGVVSDRALLAWFDEYTKTTPSLHAYASNSLDTLNVPSLNLFAAVVAAAADETVLSAMKRMSEEGVSSVAVVHPTHGTLLSAVSVTDIGKLVVPSQSNQILSTPLHQFISQIKEPDGSTDGVDKYPVYSVLPTSTLSYTIQKLLATNAHRLFVSSDAQPAASPVLSPQASGNLSGIVSIVDILSIFARLANLPIDPTSMQRHRRASSTSSSHSSSSSRSSSMRRSVPPSAPAANAKEGGTGKSPVEAKR